MPIITNPATDIPLICILCGIACYGLCKHRKTQKAEELERFLDKTKAEIVEDGRRIWGEKDKR